MLQWYGQLPAKTGWIVLFTCIFLNIFFFFTPLFTRYRLGFINGICISLLFASLGELLAWHNDIRNDQRWIGNTYHGQTMIVTVIEQPVEKAKSFKALAEVSFLLQDNQAIRTNGKILLYFKKDLEPLQYGQQLIIKKGLQSIKNSGNPGAFDYKRYSLFHGISHQVFLDSGDFVQIAGKGISWPRRSLHNIHKKVLSILRRNIKNEKSLGLAEALLIGYKDDLDRSIVQSYTNTGVVHIIAISGLHIGLIYWLLNRLFYPFRKRKKIRWLAPLSIITGLWLFSLLAGGQPSVLRSAVMFTCIVLGNGLARKTSIYNTLALSAFLLLCYNPYWLWDVGFQLSYAAVLSIIIFMQPIYNLLYSKNKLLDLIWKLNAVTISAQVLTLPLCIYHFHQFPNYFLLTNFVAVPLSSLILLGEIILIAISWLQTAALCTGKILSWLISLMNTCIEKVEILPYSLWQGLQINTAQAILLFIFIIFSGHWLIQKPGSSLKVALAALCFFFVLRSLSLLQAGHQQRMIIYNIPRQTAVDFICRRKCFFYGDSVILTDPFTHNFHLKPSHVLHRVSPGDKTAVLVVYKNYLSYRGRHILVLDHTVMFREQIEKPVIDLLLITKNPAISIPRLTNSLCIKQVIFDGSVPVWKLPRWKKDCDSLHIPYHDVSEKGAFVMNMQ